MFATDATIFVNRHNKNSLRSTGVAAAFDDKRDFNRGAVIGNFTARDLTGQLLDLKTLDVANRFARFRDCDFGSFGETLGRLTNNLHDFHNAHFPLLKFRI